MHMGLGDCSLDPLIFLKKYTFLQIRTEEAVIIKSADNETADHFNYNFVGY